MFSSGKTTNKQKRIIKQNGHKEAAYNSNVNTYETVPLVELCTLHLHACKVRVTGGDSGLCGCIYIPCIYTHAK